MWVLIVIDASSGLTTDSVGSERSANNRRPNYRRLVNSFLPQPAFLPTS